MDTVFFSEGVYKVSARVGQYTLDECAVIRSDTPIYPYFIKSVDEDPDILKLTVFLQNLNGEILSKKVTYIIDPDKETSTFQSGSLDSAGETDKTDSSSGTDPVSEVDPGITTGSASGADVGDSGPGDGNPLDGTAEEAGENEDAYRFSKRETGANPPLPYDEDIIYVKKLSGDLPPLFLPRNMEPGQYTLVFQIAGKQGVLNRIDMPFYYTGTSEFTLDDIHAYLPGIFDRGHLVPPETPVMLETNLAAGANLNPYVVWYNGKKRIHEGYVADGAARFIWRVPSQTGFHILKVEAFPFKPLNTGMRTPIGRIKELSLPVSAKNENRSLSGSPDGPETGFSDKDLIFVRRYQLFADLEDSQSPGIARNVLAVVNRTPEWLPQGNIFGLAVGPGHVFSIPGPLFTPSPRDEGRLLFRFVPLTDGTIFSGSFTLKPDPEQKNRHEPKEWFETLNMELSYAGGTVILKYSAGSIFGEKTVFLLPGQTEGVITVVVGFQVQNDTLRLSLGLNTSATFLPDGGIPLPGLLTGDGTFYLGAIQGEAGTGIYNGMQVSPAPTPVGEASDQIFAVETDDPASTEKTLVDDPDAGASRPSVTESKPVSPVIILDEFALLMVLDTSFDNRTKTVTTDPVPSVGIPEDAPAKDGLEKEEKDNLEVTTDGDERIQNDSGETAGEPEIIAVLLPPKIADGPSLILAE
jgi:hypothetical protein